MREKGIKTPLKMPPARPCRTTSTTVSGLPPLSRCPGGRRPGRSGRASCAWCSTIPEVTVADSTTGGQPTLTITAGPAVFGGDGGQVLTISARTGIPVSSVVTAVGCDVVETFQISRVTLADIQAWEF